jgi:hypothetical protein
MSDIQSITSIKDLYFSAHLDSLYLYTPNGAYQLSREVSEDLLTNLQINIEIYHGMTSISRQDACKDME